MAGRGGTPSALSTPCWRRLRYPGRDAKEITACMRLVSMPGVGRFGIFPWLDGVNTMKQVEITKKMCVSRRRQRSGAENQDTLLFRGRVNEKEPEQKTQSQAANEVGGKRENLLKVSLECVHVTHEEEECANVACVAEGLRLGWVLSEQEETCTPGESVERPLRLFCGWSEKGPGR